MIQMLSQILSQRFERNTCRSFSLLLLVLGVEFVYSAPLMAQGSPRAFIDGSALEGSLENGGQVFRGIPYAEAPIGPLRWRAPRPHAGWDGVRQAAEFGHACPQATSRSLREEEISEDCLTLNIWSPARAGTGKLPVMVWIHGGGFIQGSSRLPVYDGFHLSKEGVVVVTINYRLGLFGFFGHPDLTDEAKRERVPTANYGIMDQIAALQWVKRHIGAFGGDADNVTIFGESAGGVSVLALMVSPEARGLFHKAIAQSGGGRWDASSLDQNGRSAKSAYSRAGVAMDVLGVKGPDAVSDLRRMDWRDIVLSTANSEILNSSSPFIDGQVLTEQLPSTFERGTQAQVPFMVGSTTYEGIPLRRAFKVSTAEVLAWAGQDLEKLAALYPERGTRTDELFADYIWGDANFVEPARKIARDAAAGPSPVYYYVFDYLPPFARLLLEGTPHGLDVLYTFGSFDSILRPGLLRVINPENYAVSETMRTYWTNFAKTGNPNGGSTPWPRFDKTTNESMVFGIDGARAERDYLKERLDIINRLWTLKPPPQS